MTKQTADIPPLTGIMMQVLTRPSVTRTQLMTQFTIAERTVYRHLKTLREMGLVQHKEGDVYVRTTMADLLMQSGPLHTFAGFVDVSKFLPLGRADFWHALPVLMNDNIITVASPEAEHSVQADLHHHFTLLEKAIRHHRCCRFIYKGTRREVEPYRLCCLNSIWYLAATEQHRVKMFRLSRMQWPDILPETFEPHPAVCSLLTLSRTPWCSLDTPTCVTLKASTAIAGYFRNQSLLPEQAIIGGFPDGALLLTTKIFHPQQLFPFVRYWLPHLHIVEPAEWQQQLEEALNACRTISPSA